MVVHSLNKEQIRDLIKNILIEEELYDNMLDFLISLLASEIDKTIGRDIRVRNALLNRLIPRIKVLFSSYSKTKTIDRDILNDIFDLKGGE